MSTQSKIGRHNLRYQVKSVEVTDPPEDMPDGNWCRYVIGQGTSKIGCIRSGTLEAVTEYAESYASELNDRSLRGTSPYTQSKKKAK